MIKEVFTLELQQIDAKKLSQMFLAGAKYLEKNKEYINELNVFPVPDGDTGTNMTMTIMSAAKEVVALGDDITMKSLCKAMSSGSLRGARGNSGVILSQLLRGFTKVIKDEEFLTVAILADAFDKAVESAYKAVMQPKEGTILTVAKGAAEKARELADEGTEDLEIFGTTVLEHARYVLAQTPELLPVLKQAGVVDSGGTGLVEVLAGAVDAYTGKVTDFSLDSDETQENKESKKPEKNIRFGYLTKYVIVLNKVFNVKAEMDFKVYLETIGEEVSCTVNDDSVKVSLRTDDPGLALQKGLKYGELTDVTINNLRIAKKKSAPDNMIKAAEAQKEEQPTPIAEPPKEFGFISVSAGEGMSEIFKSLGVDYIIEGGQTMNPSTADILDAVSKVNANTIFVLPNNNNIILAANQAAELSTEKKLVVIPTATIPQGITAAINFVPDVSADENKEAMIAEIQRVKTGQITYAVRDTVIDDKEIEKDDFMGIGDKGILSAGKDRNNVTLETVAAMVDETSELISVYYGADVDEETASALAEELKTIYPSCDIEVQYGGQPIYYYVISVE